MRKITWILVLAAVSACSPKQNCEIYLDDARPIEERVEDALSKMTLEEKVGMLHAQSKFCSRGVQRLGIPEIWCTDGPHGIRPEVLWDEWDQAGWTNDSCTAFPALTCLAATWDKEMAALYGKSIGEEARYRNKTVLLGPGVNIYRTPLCGRNFEYMGEDPFLAGTMVAPYVKGVQSNGVAACVKHYALNNQEENRHGTNVIVDDRTLYEIYLPAFKSAVINGGAWAIMGSYNLYDNMHSCSNPVLLNKILKGEWGFDGVVISDWGGAHSEAVAANGLDLEYGTSTDGLGSIGGIEYDYYWLANPYLERLRNGEEDLAVLDDKVRRILRLEFRTNMNRNRPYGSIASPEHFAAARTIGAGGIVLLKNDGNVLPVDASSVKKVLVVGENAIKMMTVGGGSSSLKSQHEISPLDGLKAALPGVQVCYERGYVGDIGGNYNGVSTGQDLSESRSDEKLVEDALLASADADYVIAFVGLNKSNNQDCEGEDRLSYALPYNQDNLIKALAEANDNLVVVNISGNAVAMPWVNEVPAIVQGWFLGSEAGNSLADVITGKVNPSGKLPFTFPVALEDGPIKTAAQYPGIPREDSPIVDETYSEGIYVGYRWYEKQAVPVLFPFGHGLSYTEFTYGDAECTSVMKNGKIKVSVPVTNKGTVAGAEVVQLYIAAKESSVDRAVKELKNFEKVYLEPGQTAVVKFEVCEEDLAYFDADTHSWVSEKGEYEVLVGSSSADIRTTATFCLK